MKEEVVVPATGRRSVRRVIAARAMQTRRRVSRALLEARCGEEHSHEDATQLAGEQVPEKRWDPEMGAISEIG